MVSQSSQQPDAQSNHVENQARQLMAGSLNSAIKNAMLMRSRQQTKAKPKGSQQMG